jgi:hypothetical protein
MTDDMVESNTQHWRLDPRASGTATTQGPDCLKAIVVKVDISHTKCKSGHDVTKSVSKNDDIPSGKDEALPTKIRLPRKGMNSFYLVKLTSPGSCGYGRRYLGDGMGIASATL